MFLRWSDIEKKKKKINKTLQRLPLKTLFSTKSNLLTNWNRVNLTEKLVHKKSKLRKALIVIKAFLAMNNVNYWNNRTETNRKHLRNYGDVACKMFYYSTIIS